MSYNIIEWIRDVHIVNSCLTKFSGGIILLFEDQILFFYITFIADSIVLKLFFDMKSMKAVKVSLVVNFLSGVLFPFFITLLLFIMSPFIITASEFVGLGYLFAILIIFVSIKVLIVHVIFKISITKFRFLLFMITYILALVLLYGLSEIEDKMTAEKDVKHAEKFYRKASDSQDYYGSRKKVITNEKIH